MDIRGIWKVKEMRLPSPDGELVFTPGNLPDDESWSLHPVICRMTSSLKNLAG